MHSPNGCTFPTCQAPEKHDATGKEPEEKGKNKSTGEGQRYTTEQHPRLRKRRIRVGQLGREGQGELASTTNSCSIKEWCANHHYMTFKQH